MSEPSDANERPEANDEEWARWKARFKEGGRPMPSVLKRARSDRRRALWGMGGIYAIATCEVVGQLPTLRHARVPADYLAPLFIFSATAILIGSVHVAMHGTIGAARGERGTPRELLDAMERRNAGRRRLLRFMPWGTGYVVAGTLALCAVEIHGFDVGLIVAVALACLGTIALVALTIHRTRARLARDAREATEARRLLEEDEGA